MWLILLIVTRGGKLYCSLLYRHVRGTVRNRIIFSRPCEFGICNDVTLLRLAKVIFIVLSIIISVALVHCCWIMPHIINEVKLDFKDVLLRPKRSTLKSRSDVSFCLLLILSKQYCFQFDILWNKVIFLIWHWHAVLSILYISVAINCWIDRLLKLWSVFKKKTIYYLLTSVWMYMCTSLMTLYDVTLSFC